MSATAALIFLWLAWHGYGPVQRDAVFVHARVESGLRPGAVSRHGDAGLFQWRGPRKRALFAYARAMRRPWRDALLQLEFMDREWRAMPASAGFFAAASRSEAYRTFCRHFERRRCR